MFCVARARLRADSHARDVLDIAATHASFLQEVASKTMLGRKTLRHRLK
jgi:hypothetical protein